MSEFSMFPVVFYLLAGVTVFSALGVALSNNIIYSAFALMGALLGAAGLFVMLAADFIAVVQVFVYVGGILVLTLFAVMLTHRVADVRVSNRSLGRIPALICLVIVGGVMGRAVLGATWHRVEPGTPAPTIAVLGNGFLTDYILPFELASLVLLAALVGAVVLSRKELREG
jgi:NAD(P)H-quinone oxidoreductase subunit 6